MNKNSKSRRLQKKKITLQEVKEDEYDEGLLTNEEIEIIKANEKTIKTNNKNMTRSDYLVDEYSFQSRTRNNQYSSGNKSIVNNSYISNRNNQKQKSKQKNISIDEYDEEEEDDVFNKLGDEDVKVILEDVIKTKDSTVQRKNQDYFCQILAQMILKNKINKENAFEIPLPDVKNMSDFAKVSESSWQKLSSSLDSGSKIYGYRVDSLHQESFKMLGGLIRSEYQYKDTDQQNRSEDDSEDLINKEREKIFKKNKKINEETIEKNISNITLNKYDIQFEVDPLFCKTSAKFDDGSSKGILLNNISIDANLKLLIDSENFVHKQLNETSGKKSIPPVLQTPSKQVNFFQDNQMNIKQIQKDIKHQKIRRKYIIQQIKGVVKTLKDINELELCNELEYFVNNLLTFDDSSRKIKSKLIEDDSESNQQMNIMQDIAMNENEEELINDIQTIMTQTAQKGRVVSSQTNQKLKMINEIKENENEQDDEYNEYSQRSTYMTPYHQLNVKENNFDSIDRLMTQSQSNQMDVLNEGPQVNYLSDQALYNEDNDTNTNSYQQNDYLENSSSQYRLFTDDLNSRSSNDFASDVKSEYDNRLFSLQNMSIRMTQIGNGQFFNQIEKDKNQWMNPTDWHMQKLKQQIDMIPETNAIDKKRANKQLKPHNEIRIDFFDNQIIQYNDLLGKKKKQTQRINNKIVQNCLISKDYHYKPTWLFRTSLIDIKEIEEQERQRQQRLLELEEEYKGFNGDDEDDIINQIDEQTLLGATPFRKGQMEMMDDNFYNDDLANDRLDDEVPYYTNTQQTQMSNIENQSQSNIESKSQKQQMKKSKIKMLKSFYILIKYFIIRINLKKDENIRVEIKIMDKFIYIFKQLIRYSHLLKTFFHLNQLSYQELLNKLELQKSESASIQSCLVAVLHLCNENNLSLYDNELDNFYIKKNYE